jgi:hypothetical protein
MKLTILMLMLLGGVAPEVQVPSIEVFCRADWNSKKIKGPYTPHTIERITVHHQGVMTHKSEDYRKRLRKMQRYHQTEQKGFVDIAYHFVIDRNGVIFEGRPTTAAGETETDYDPKGHLLICLLGDFDKQKPSVRQMESLIKLAAWASRHFHVSPDTLAGHRDYAHTSCPGIHLHSAIRDGSLISDIKALLTRGGVKRIQRCP